MPHHHSCAHLADDENLRRDVTRGRGLGGLHLAKELLEDPNEGVVVTRAKDFGHKDAVLAQKLGRKFERLEHKRGCASLGEGVGGVE